MNIKLILLIHHWVKMEKGTAMPKLKTNKGAAKRFGKTKGGKIKRHKAYASHLLTSKSPKRKRSLRKSSIVKAVDSKNIKRLIPYA